MDELEVVKHTISDDKTPAIVSPYRLSKFSNITKDIRYIEV